MPFISAHHTLPCNGTVFLSLARKHFNSMTSLRIACVAVLSLFAGACDSAGSGDFSRDGANDQTNVDSSGTIESGGDMGEESRNVDFRSSTSALPDSAHPSADRNANGHMTNEGQSRDGDPR